MIELIYDNLLKEFVVYDQSKDDAVFVGEFQEASFEYMLALFNVPKVKESVSDGGS